MKKITLVAHHNKNDLEGLYIDGKLVVQNAISDYLTADEVLSALRIDYDFIYLDENYGDSIRSFPKNLGDNIPEMEEE